MVAYRAAFSASLRARLVKFASGVGGVLAACLLSGCLPSFSGPDRLYPVSAEIASIQNQALLPDFTTYATMPEPVKVSYRNELVMARMYAIDIEYSQYEAGLTTERQAANFGAAAATIGLTGAATLVSATQTKDILATTAGAVTGTNAAYNEQVLLNRSIQILQSQMRAERAHVSTRIIKGLQLSSLDYTLGQALSDLEEYYRAGTIAGALIDVSQTVGQEALTAKVGKDLLIISSGVPTDSTAAALLAFWRPGGVVSKDHQAQLIALMKLAPPISLPLIVVVRARGPDALSARQELLRRARAQGLI